MLLRTIYFGIISLFLMQAGNAIASKNKKDRRDLIHHAACGRQLDKFYYDAGTKVDIALFDLQEARRQGHSVPHRVMTSTTAAAEKLRSEWLKVEQIRAKLFSYLYLPQPKSSYLVCIENMGNAPADYSGWIGLKSVDLQWGNGQKINLPLSSFLNSSFKKKYSYNCSPAPAIFIRGKKSAKHTTVTTVVPKREIIGNVELVLCGLDCDKPGAPVPMKVYIYGKLIYDGANPFKKHGWTTVKIKVPATAFSKNIAAKSNNNFAEQFTELELKIRQFGDLATGIVDHIEKLTAQYRKNLIYQYKPYKIADFNRTFHRGIDVSNSIYGLKRFRYPGMYANMEYVAKAIYSSGFNFASLLVRNRYSATKYEQLIDTFDQYCGMPWFLWADGKYFIGGESVNNAYYANSKKLNHDIDNYLAKFKKLKFLAGIQLDEPYINAKSKKLGDILGNRQVLADYAKYLTARKSLLMAHNIHLTSLAPFTRQPKNDNELALWLEWQYYKKELLAKHFAQLYMRNLKHNIYTSTVQMTRNATTPQNCSYVSTGAVMPYIGTDLYANGNISESINIQLLKNASKGKVVMWPAGGYNSKTPATYKRTLANATVFADGFHIWEYTYIAKYRDPNYFWRYGGHRDNNDDQGTSQLNNWFPELWEITGQVIKTTRAADAYLMKRQSLAKIAVAFSERTIITRSATKNTINYWQNLLGIYTDIVARGLVADAIFVENLTPEKIAQYKVIVLADALTLSPNEINCIEQWVKNGGALVTVGETIKNDRWGRRLNSDKIPAIAIKQSQSYGKGEIIYFFGKNVGIAKTGLPETGLAGQGTKIMQKITAKVKAVEGQVMFELVDAPYGVQLFAQHKDDVYIINLIDWFNKRNIDHITLKINLPGDYQVYDPATGKSIKLSSSLFDTGKFKTWKMLIIKKETN